MVYNSANMDENYNCSPEYYVYRDGATDTRGITIPPPPPLHNRESNNLMDANLPLNNISGIIRQLC